MDATAAAVAETHTAVVVFVGDRAYKLKKPVSLGFLDFSTVEARRRACDREVELNRRLAPDVYLGVADVVDDQGRVCDHLVVMRRMPADRRLTTCLAAGEDVRGSLRLVAREVAALHLRAPHGPQLTWAGSLDQLSRNWHDSFEQMAPHVGSIFPEETAARVELLVDRYLAGRTALFDRRIREGRVCDGHGDLQADDIFLLPDGPRILDCIEFSDELRWCDVLNDVAFLAMDLEWRGHRDLAQQFLSWHREFTADSWPPSLADHYVAYRAHVRAKVNAIRAAQGEGRAVRQARELLDLARVRLEQGRVRLVLIGGLPGTGKSTLAGAISEQLPVVVLASDELRAPASSGQPAGLDAGRYSPERVAANYREMIDKAERLLELGESVVLDASWNSDEMRDRARSVAQATSSELVELQCVAPLEVTSQRIIARRAAGEHLSDATPEIAAAMARRFDPWSEATVVDTTSSVAVSAAQAVDALV